MTIAHELEAHPATDLFPMMDEASLAELADDIEAHGLIEPIVLHDGKILDGRNRLRACESAGVEPRYTDWHGDGMTPTEWVISVNLKRRHLTAGQKAAVGVEAIPMLAEDAKRRQGGSGRFGSSQKWDEPETRPPNRAGKSTHIAAMAVGVGHSTISQVKRVKDGAPDLYERVKTGELAPSRADDLLKQRHEPPRTEEPEPNQKRAPTWTVETEKGRQVLDKARRRFSQGVITLFGECAALGQVDIAKVVAIATDDEIETWLRQLKESSAQIRNVERQLKEVRDDRKVS